MLNPKQIDVAERIVVNTANVVLGSLVLSNILRFNLKMVLIGGIIFLLLAGWAIWLKKGES